MRSAVPPAPPSIGFGRRVNGTILTRLAADGAIGAVTTHDPAVTADPYGRPHTAPS